VLGSLRYRFPIYFLALALAELPFAMAAVLLSSGFLERQYWTMAVVGVAGIAFLAWAIRRLHRELEGKPASAIVVSTP
jgi:threonine/homoserine/homoserine lactone efflux protein